MRTLCWIVVPVLVSLVLALGGCSAHEDPKPTVVTEEAEPCPGGALPDVRGLEPGAVVQTFYEWYLACTSGRERRNPLAEGLLETTGCLSRDLVAHLQETVASYDRGGADPILCAQDVPSSVTVLETQIDADQAQVLLGTSFQGHVLRIGLEQREGWWQIVDIRCGMGDASPGTAPAAERGAKVELAPRQGWLVYRNAVHGFQIEYPEDWTFEELEAQPDQPPIGPPNVRLLVLFQPQQWTLSTPFTLEITEGTWEAYRASQAPPQTSTPIQLGSYPALCEEEQVNESIVIVRYLLEDPRKSQRRFTFLDYVSGFPQRIQGNEESVATFREMLSTLALVD